MKEITIGLIFKQTEGPTGDQTISKCLQFRINLFFVFHSEPNDRKKPQRWNAVITTQLIE